MRGCKVDIDMIYFTTPELYNLLDAHDCHMSGEDGCECLTIIDELRRRMLIREEVTEQEIAII